MQKVYFGELAPSVGGRQLEGRRKNQDVLTEDGWERERGVSKGESFYSTK